MKDKITVYGLLSKIYNGNTDMPKKICFCGYDYYWDNDSKDYIRTSKAEYNISFLENHNDNLMAFLQDTVDIIQDNKTDRAEYQTSQIPPWFKVEEVIRVTNENFEKHTKAIYKIIDKLNEVLNEKDR